MSLAEQIAAVLRPCWEVALRLDGDTLAFGEWLAIERRFHEAGIEARAHRRGVAIMPNVDITFDVATSPFDVIEVLVPPEVANRTAQTIFATPQTLACATVSGVTVSLSQHGAGAGG
jgi:hypothetical protein